MKQLSANLILMIFIIISCNTGDSSKTSTAKKILPDCTGGEFEILVVGENITKRQELKDIIDSCIYEIIPALPQIEYWFSPTYVDIENFNSLYRRHINILLISVNDKGMNKFIDNELTESGVDNKNKIKSVNHRIIKDKWSDPQLIFLFEAPNKEKLLSSLLENKNHILENFDANEKTRLRRLMYKSGIKNKLTSQLKEKHKFILKTPKNYQIIKENIPPTTDSTLLNLKLNGLVWLRGETKKSQVNIMIYYTAFQDSFLEHSIILKLKNEVWKELTHGENKGSYLTTEERYFPEFKQTKLGQTDALEIRGLWKMVDDWGGGPFIDYIIHDKKNNRLIYIDAFIFAPGTKKKKFTKRLEIILNTFQI